MIERVRDQKERHKQRGKAYRVSVATVGVLLVLAGAVLSLPLVPGPGLLVAALGLAILALESDRAERLLERVLQRLERASEAASRAGRVWKAVAVLATVVAVGVAAVAVVLFDIPLLPGATVERFERR